MCAIAKKLCACVCAIANEECDHVCHNSEDDECDDDQPWTAEAIKVPP